MPLEVHPAAEIFPMMSGSDFAALKADIRQNGQRERIVVFDEKILDGRNRHSACLELGIEPEVCELEACHDPVAYVLSMNLHRRHLSPGQRATVAARIEQLRHGGNRKADQDANLRLDRSHVGTMLSISPRSVCDAQKVLKKGHDSLIQKMEAGEIAPSLAAKFVDAVPNKRDQAKDVTKGKAAVQEAVRESKPVPQIVAKVAPVVAPAPPAEKPARFKQFIRFWGECDDVARAAIRAFILTDGAA